MPLPYWTPTKTHCPPSRKMVPTASRLIKPLTLPHQCHTRTFSSASVGIPMRSTPPHYIFVPTPLNSTELSHLPSLAHFIQERVKALDSWRQVTLDPNELSRALTRQIQRYPRNCPGSRNVSLIHSLLLLGHTATIIPLPTSVPVQQVSILLIPGMPPFLHATRCPSGHSVETIPPNAGPQGIETAFSDAFTLRYFMCSASSATITGSIPLSFGGQKGQHESYVSSHLICLWSVASPPFALASYKPGNLNQ
ncbi:hypothetical protein BU17DRAFT_88172 [Hysterangium stoloniferum]|nr:hypothetical protein BU17DRAFT_88172 [Hysterangium stoloniferum]